MTEGSVGKGAVRDAGLKSGSVSVIAWLVRLLNVYFVISVVQCLLKVLAAPLSYT